MQELRAQNATKVRASLAVLGFTKTPLFKGETNQPRFLMPLLHVDTVVDAIVDILTSGLSQTVFLPGIFSYFAGLVSRLTPPDAGFLLRLCSGECRIGFRILFAVARSL